MLTIDKLTAHYGQTIALDDFSLHIHRGEIYSLIGPSGCGKSTLLKVLCGIHLNYTGDIEYNGRSIKPQEIRIGYVPQNYGLLEWKKVKANILIPFEIDKTLVADQTEINEIIHSLQIEDLLDRYPSQLSGGQKQRVALARAFVSKPELLLMDEPFSSLDTFTSNEAQKIFLKLWRKYQITTLFITHNIHESISLGKHIILMDKTDGKIKEEVTNPLFGIDGKEQEKLNFAGLIIKKAGY